MFNFCFADPLIVAHFGSSQQAPENTLPAFRLAWEEGADAIKRNFLSSKDGKIISMHDVSNIRLAGRKLVLSKSNLEELRGLDVGIWKMKYLKVLRYLQSRRYLQLFQKERKYSWKLKVVLKSLLHS